MLESKSIGDIIRHSLTHSREYFKKKCEYVATSRHPSRFTTSAVSRPLGAPFKTRQSLPGTRNGAAIEPMNLTVTGPTPMASLLLDPPRPEDLEKGEYHEGVPEEDAEPILPDIRTFSSSPEAQSELLSPISPPPREGIEFAHSTSITPSQLRRRRAMTRQQTIAETRRVQGLGNIPGPGVIVKSVVRRAAPGVYKHVRRQLTIPSVQTLQAKDIPWLNFDLIVGPNSDFRAESLTDEQVEQIGGTEYKALRFLSYLVPLVCSSSLPNVLSCIYFQYFVLSQVFSFILFAPWISTTNKYDSVFEAQPRLVKKPWYVPILS